MILTGLALLSGVLLGGTWEQAETWRSDGVALSVPAGERLAAQRLFNELLAGAPADILPVDFERRAAGLGLDVQFQPGVVLLHGDGGVFAVRLGDPEIPPLILQAPHAWYDFKTGRISGALFDAGVSRALFLNGGHRFGGVEGDDPRFDLAHRYDTLYQAATVGAAQGLIDPMVVQLHGYGGNASPFANGSAYGPGFWPGGPAGYAQFMPSSFRVQRSTRVRLANLMEQGRVTTAARPSEFLAAGNGTDPRLWNMVLQQDGEGVCDADATPGQCATTRVLDRPVLYEWGV